MNPRKRALRVKLALGPQEVKTDISEEIEKCKKDAFYFLEKYLELSFSDAEKKMIESFWKDQSKTVVHSVKSDVHVLQAAYLLCEKVLNNSEINYIFITPKKADGDKLFEVFEKTLKNVPEWLMPKFNKVAHQTFKFSKSEIKGFSAGTFLKENGESELSDDTVIFLNDSATIDNSSFDELLSNFLIKNKSFVFSKSNGPENSFAELYKKSENLGFEQEEFYWEDCLNFDSEEYALLKNSLSEQTFAYDFECSFKSFEKPAVELDAIEKVPPQKKRKYTKKTKSKKKE